MACWAMKIGWPRIGVCRPSFFGSAGASRSSMNLPAMLQNDRQRLSGQIGPFLRPQTEAAAKRASRQRREQVIKITHTNTRRRARAGRRGRRYSVLSCEDRCSKIGNPRTTALRLLLCVLRGESPRVRVLCATGNSPTPLPGRGRSCAAPSCRWRGLGLGRAWRWNSRTDWPAGRGPRSPCCGRGCACGR